MAKPAAGLSLCCNEPLTKRVPGICWKTYKYEIYSITYQFRRYEAEIQAYPWEQFTAMRREKSLNGRWELPEPLDTTSLYWQGAGSSRLLSSLFKIASQWSLEAVICQDEFELSHELRIPTKITRKSTRAYIKGKCRSIWFTSCSSTAEKGFHRLQHVYCIALALKTLKNHRNWNTKLYIGRSKGGKWNDWRNSSLIWLLRLYVEEMQEVI